MADSIAVKISQLRSLPRLAVQFPTRRNHSFQFFWGVGPIPRKSATPEREAKTRGSPNSSATFFLFLQSTGRIPRSSIRAARTEKRKEKNEERRIRERTLLKAHFSFAYSALACFRMGMWGRRPSRA